MVQKIINEVFDNSYKGDMSPVSDYFYVLSPEDLANTLIKVLEGLPVKKVGLSNGDIWYLVDYYYIQSTIELIRKKVEHGKT